MHKYKLTLAYDGTCYAGWQVQDNAISIQTHVSQALSTALREPIHCVGSGRTDAGVHALGQTAHFETSQSVDIFRLLGSLNGLLPHDIRILDLVSAPQEFHARYSAIGKEYHYHLHLDRVMNPFKRLYTFHVLHPFNRELFCEAARVFVGKHDFTSFANEAHKGSASKDPVRTLHRLDIVPEEGGLRLEFEGDGFLYRMVRNIVGTLLEVAAEKLTVENIYEIIAAKDRKRAGPAAQPQGLFLMRVEYPD